MDAKTLSDAMGGTLPAARYAELAPAFTDAMQRAGCTTVNRLTTDYWFAKVSGSVLELGVLETDSAWLQVLVGPAGSGIPIPAEAAKVSVWSRIHGTPEVPVQLHGTISVTG